MPTTDTIRVAVEIRDDHGTWQRAVEVTRPLPGNDSSGALHVEATEVMDSCYVDWHDRPGADRWGDPVTRRHGRPVRALVLPVDPADGDTDLDALHIWGGPCALPQPA